jgi:hypothetical protein
MTTETDLLPLPEWMSNYTIPADDFDCDNDVMLDDRMHDYARANVANAIAPLQAEIEALRAEAAEAAKVLRGALDSSTDGEPLRVLAIRASNALYWRTERIERAEARAERLAEAINAYKSECDNPVKDYLLRARRRDEMFALLRELEEGK